MIPLNVTAGAEVSQYLEFAESPVTGQLAVQSDPPGAKVLVDGVERGVAPVTISDLTPGDHRVELQSDGVRRKAHGHGAGWRHRVAGRADRAGGGCRSGFRMGSVKAPFTMEIREQGRLLGTSDAERLMMAAGRHELDLVNDTLGYRASRVVVVPGQGVARSLELPMGVVNLNAAPWAEVWIDGRRVGETPIGNLNVSIGPHESCSSIRSSVKNTMRFRSRSGPRAAQRRHEVNVVMHSVESKVRHEKPHSRHRLDPRGVCGPGTCAAARRS